MKRTYLTIITLLVVFLTADRLPAPIVETPENPTPAPEQAWKPKWKRQSKTKSQTSGSDNQSAKIRAPAGPARFAGGWSGTINGLLGAAKVSFTINANGSSVKMTAGERPATVSGNTIGWKSGMFNEISWTLTPLAGGSTALVTSKSALGGNGTATFVKTQQLVTAPSTQPTITSNPAANLPTAKPVSDRPGFVYNPFDPTGRAVFDVRNQAHGATVRDPASGRLFIVP